MKLFYLAVLFSITVHSQGLKFTTNDELSKLPQLPTDTYGFAEDLSSSYSLEKYVPPVLNQTGGTCVGFSTFYYALSTMYNIKFDITSLKEKYVHAFDPYFIYSIVYNDKSDCDSGLFFRDAFLNLNKIGAKKLFLPPFTACDTKWTQDKLTGTLGYTVPYSINDYYVLNNENLNTINTVKEIISIYDTPVIIGMSFVKSMWPYNSENLNGVKSDGLWNPSDIEQPSGGHALCVIGYDDDKYGGAFRIVNSWGVEYGDKGYFWVKYADFKKYAKEIYILELNKNILVKPPTIINETNFKRYSYKTDMSNLSTYEGQYLDNSVTGYGIWSDKDNQSYYIGKFNKANMNGYFLIVDNDGIFSANAVDGKFYDIDQLGFADNEEISETNAMAIKFFKKLDAENTIKKVYSTKTNNSKPKKE